MIFLMEMGIFCYFPEIEHVVLENLPIYIQRLAMFEPLLAGEAERPL
jgi:hypothetical protein